MIVARSNCNQIGVKRRSNGSHIEIESKSNRSCNHRLSLHVGIVSFHAVSFYMISILKKLRPKITDFGRRDDPEAASSGCVWFGRSGQDGGDRKLMGVA